MLAYKNINEIENPFEKLMERMNNVILGEFLEIIFLNKPTCPGLLHIPWSQSQLLVCWIKQIYAI